MDESAICLPYEIVEGGPDVGRYLVASRKITKGEVIMQDLPLLCAPIYTRSKPVCLECLKIATDDSYRCSKCKYPVCDKKCEEGRWHSLECSYFVSSSYFGSLTDCSSYHPLYSCIAPLRLLIMKDKRPQDWKMLDSFMDHGQARSKDAPAWKLHELLVFNLVSKSLGLPFTEEEVRRAIGIIRTNSVKLETKKQHGDGIAVYPTYTYLNHSCICNTRTKKHRSDNKLELLAINDIDEGKQIWTRYTTPQLGNFQRVMDIQKTWHFTCTCQRCSDPTEFGTMMSAVRCNVRDCQGFLLPKRSTLIGSPWQCSACSKSVGISIINDIIKTCQGDIRKQRDESSKDLAGLISRLEERVHPNHYLILGVKEIIIQRCMEALKDLDLSPEEKLDLKATRNVLFRSIAEVLEKVDNPGAGWMEKVKKMETE